MSAYRDKFWYQPPTHAFLRCLLSPFSMGFQLITKIRRRYLQTFCQITPSVPVIVVGNLTVGGVGKTPLVIALACQLKNKGLRVGIVSRGYGARIKHFPYEIQLNDQAAKVGDEPLLMAKKTNCPVVIAPKRMQAIQYLIDHHQIQVILSDDGLQHYRMGRAIEIAVIDGTRGLGNGLCLPVGPLRESKSRLTEVDFVVVNEGTWPDAYPMTLRPGKVTHLKTNEEIDPQLLSQTVAAVAGIGNPDRFYATLSQLGIKYNPYSFPDHYQFNANDLNYPELTLIMTEKDAVKCRSFSMDSLYYLPVEAQLNDAFWDALWSHKHLQGFF